MTREELIEDILEAVKRRSFAWYSDPKNFGTVTRNIGKSGPVAKHLRRGGVMPNDPPWPFHRTAVSQYREKHATSIADLEKEAISKYAPRSMKSWKPRLIN